MARSQRSAATAAHDTMTVAEAALQLGLSYNPTLRLILTGRIRGERSGKRWVVDAASVARYQKRRGTR